MSVLQRVMEENEQLKAKIAELEKDKARLDWLDEMGYRILYKNNEYSVESIREAIDKAVEETD